MEQSIEREHASVARNQNVVTFAPHGASAITRLLGPVVERFGQEDGATRVLVLTPDSDTAVMAAGAALTQAPAGSLRALAATAPARAARLLRAAPATLVAGTPSVLLDLVRGSVLKLDGVRAIILAWPDAILAAGMTDALDSVMGEVPKDAARTLVASRATPEVEALADRYAWRARRPDAEGTAGADAEGVDVRYVACAPTARGAVLRRLLDERDPERAAVYARDDDAAAEAAATLRALGYAEGSEGAALTRGDAPEGASLVVLYELPPTRASLRALAVTGAEVLALVTPAQLPALRALAGGGRARPLTLTEPIARARSREERMRDELRAALADGAPARELLALEPLLSEYDGTEIAAAALRLLDHARTAAPPAAAEPAPAAPPAPKGGTTRIFVSAGERDRVAARDLVGAIANEAGVPGDRIGRVEVRESHSVVEVPTELAEQVIARLTGVSLRGRRLVARLDAGGGRPPRAPRGEGAPPRGGRDGGREARPRGPRPQRSPRPPRRERE